MARRYRVTGDLRLLGHEPGDEFEHEYTADEETTLVAAGRIEIVPIRYRVVGDSRVFENSPGRRFLWPLGIAQEAALIEGGHIEVIAGDKPAPPKSKKE